MPCNYSLKHHCPIERFCDTHSDVEMTEAEFNLVNRLCPHFTEITLGMKAARKWRDRKGAV